MFQHQCVDIFVRNVGVVDENLNPLELTVDRVLEMFRKRSGGVVVPYHLKCQYG